MNWSIRYIKYTEGLVVAASDGDRPECMELRENISPLPGGNVLLHYCKSSFITFSHCGSIFHEPVQLPKPTVKAAKPWASLSWIG